MFHVVQYSTKNKISMSMSNFKELSNDCTIAIKVERCGIRYQSVELGNQCRKIYDYPNQDVMQYFVKWHFVRWTISSKSHLVEVAFCRVGTVSKDGLGILEKRGPNLVARI